MWLDLWNIAARAETEQTERLARLTDRRTDRLTSRNSRHEEIGRKGKRKKNEILRN